MGFATTVLRNNSVRCATRKILDCLKTEFMLCMQEDDSQGEGGAGVTEDLLKFGKTFFMMLRGGGS